MSAFENGFTYVTECTPESLGIDGSGRLVESNLATSFGIYLSATNAIKISVAGGSYIASDNNAYVFGQSCIIVISVSSLGLCSFFVNCCQS